MSLDKLFKAKQKQDKLTEFKKELKENPLQVTEFKNLVNSFDDFKEKAKMIAQIDNFKKQGLVIDDIMPTYEEFCSHHFTEKTGKYPVRSSYLKQMDKEDSSLFTSVQLAIYQDVPHQSEIVGYTDGYMEYSHGREKPTGMRYEKVDLGTQEGVDKFNKAVSERKKVKDYVELNKNSILEGRKSGKYEEFFPLPDKYKDESSIRESER